MARERDELGRFVAAAGEAADRLKGFTRQVDESTRASANAAREEREQAESRMGRVAAGLGAAGLGALGAGGAALAGRTAGQLQAGGDFGDALNASLAGGIMALGNVPLIGNLTGATQAGAVLGRAGGRVSDVTGDLARYGIEVSDEFRRGLIDTAVQQERRVEDENQAVMSALGEKGATDTAFGRHPFAEEIRSALDLLRQIAEAVGRFLPSAS